MDLSEESGRRQQLITDGVVENGKSRGDGRVHRILLGKFIYLRPVDWSLMKQQQIEKIFRWRSENIDFAMRSFALCCLLFFHLDACLPSSFDLPASAALRVPGGCSQHIFRVVRASSGS
jgi:hypothetical protein